MLYQHIAENAKLNCIVSLLVVKRLGKIVCKSVWIAVQKRWFGGTKVYVLQFLATNKRLFGCKQKTFRLEAKDLSLTSKNVCQGFQ